MLDRVRKRLEGEDIADDGRIEEYIKTVKDRLCIRLGEVELPEAFQSVCVDAVVKMYRRLYYEGITSEGTTNLTTSFVENVLAEYEREITDWKERRKNEAGSGRTVRFL